VEIETLNERRTSCYVYPLRVLESESVISILKSIWSSSFCVYDFCHGHEIGNVTVIAYFSRNYQGREGKQTFGNITFHTDFFSNTIVVISQTQLTQVGRWFFTQVKKRGTYVCTCTLTVTNLATSRAS
jgi:hypothetical protein